MSTQQVTPEQAPAQTMGQKSVLDDIIENQAARAQAEGAKADQLTAKIYANDPNAYAIAMGRDLGLNAALALQNIHIIGGKPALGAGARAMFLAQAGYSWRPVVHTEKQCTLRFYFRGDGMTDVDGKPLDVTITMEDAERAGWVQNSRGSGKVGNYDKIPKNMLFARVISNFHRWYAPHVVGAQVYDVGEVTMENVIAATESKSASKLDALEAELLTATAEKAAANV
jgi:hypothetical protein